MPFGIRDHLLLLKRIRKPHQKHLSDPRSTEQSNQNVGCHQRGECAPRLRYTYPNTCKENRTHDWWQTPRDWQAARC